jgi:hypothetical protein
MLYDIEVAINETYSSEMSDNSTEEFRSIAQIFCNQVGKTRYLITEMVLP